MADLFTYMVYVLLLTILIYLTSRSTKKSIYSIGHTLVAIPSSERLDKYQWIALLLLSIIVGFRHNVGVDWEGYVDIFNDFKSSKIQGFGDIYVEPGYFLVNKLVTDFGGAYTIMFLIVGGLSWYFIFKSVNPILLPLTIFFVFADEYFFWSMNGVRQFVAISVFVYSIRFMIDRKLVGYLACLLIASAFHISALALVPLYFLPYDRMYNQKFWIVAFIVSYVLVNNSILIGMFEFVMYSLASYFPIFSIYLRYFETGRYEAVEASQGFGFFIRLFISMLIVIMSKKVIASYAKSTPYFILFFIGTVLFNVFHMFHIISRLNHYFLIFRSFVLAIVVYWLWKHNERWLAYLIVILYSIMYIALIQKSSNMCSPYQFKLVL